MLPRPHDRTDRYAQATPASLPSDPLTVASQRRAETHRRDLEAAYKGARILHEAEQIARGR